MPLSLIKHYSTDTYGGIKIQLRVFLTSSLDGSDVFHDTEVLPPGKDPFARIR
jgi:hypothetical protein